MKPRRRIRDAKITHVSLCKRGANRLPVLFKSKDGKEVVEVAPIVKYDDDQGEMTALVYIPDHVDADGDTAEADAIRKMCHSWAASGSQVDINHDLKPLSRDQVFVAENFIVQKDDPRFRNWTDSSGKPVDATGGWAQVYKFIDPDLRAAAKAGEIGGVSMYGPAEVEQLTDADLQAIAKSVLDALTDGSDSASATNTNEIDMTIEELKAALAANNESLLAKVDEKLAPILAKSDDDPDPKDSADADGGDKQLELEFEGDKSNPEDIAKHAEKLQLAQLEKSVNWSDPRSVAAYAEALAKHDEGKKKQDDDNYVDLGKTRSRAAVDNPVEIKAPKGVVMALGNHRGAAALIEKSDQDAHIWGVQAARELNEIRRAERTQPGFAPNHTATA